MLEPLAALGLAANIVQLVGFGARLVDNVEAVLDSSVKSLPENLKLLDLTSKYESLYNDVTATLSKQPQLNPSERAAGEAVTHLHDEVNLLVAELEDLEVSPATRKLKRGLSAAWQTFRTHRKAGDLKARQRRLAELTNVLGAKLLLLLNESSDSRIGHLNSALEAQGVRTSSDVQKLCAAVFSLIKSQEQQAIKERIQLIRQSLLFDSMNYRMHIIAERHRRTFEWCFSNESSPLMDWLVSGSNIFWVRGKAGSGKSTFLKFLSHHRSTLAALRKWAGSRQLVMAEHFFYYAGTPMQKSHQGLLQSLLSQVLLAVSSRQLASCIREERWAGGDGGISRPWSRDEVLETLISLGKLDDTIFCFFIDGLDEYHPHAEHDRLIADLMALVSVPNVKICTSSRPWTEFVEAFGSSAEQLRLEDLTRDDITEYTRDNLAAAILPVSRLVAEYMPQVLDELGEKVANKAQGVFLWVYLVVSALKEQLRARSSTAKMYECIEAFPSELEDYFKSFIYDRIHETLRNDAAQALKLAWLIRQHAQENLDLSCPKLTASYGYNSSTGYSQKNVRRDYAKKSFVLASDMAVLHSFLPFWILRTGMQKPQFAVTMEVCVYPRSEMEAMITVVRQYLSACCKDLLWISPAQNDNTYEPCEYKVEFLHRTVYDFISTPEMAELLDRNIPRHFNERTVLLDVTVACLKVIIDAPQDTKFDRCEDFFDAACGVTHIAQSKDHNATSQRCMALKELDTIGAQYSEFYCVATETMVCQDAKRLCCLFEFMICHQLYRYSKACLRKCNRMLPGNLAPTAPDLHLRLNPTTESVPPGRQASAVLLASLGLRIPYEFPVQHVDEEMVHMLLKHGFNPNKTAENVAPSSVWIIFLQAWLESRTIAESSVLHTDNQNDEAGLKFWRLAKLMIEYSADLWARVSLPPSSARAAHLAPSENRTNVHHYSVKEILEHCVPACSRTELDLIFKQRGRVQP